VKALKVWIPLLGFAAAAIGFAPDSSKTDDAVVGAIARAPAGSSMRTEAARPDSNRADASAQASANAAPSSVIQSPLLPELPQSKHFRVVSGAALAKLFPPRPSNAPPAPAKPPPAPVAAPPEPEIRFLGKVLVENTWRLIVGVGDRTMPAVLGDVIADRYQVLSIAPPRLVLRDQSNGAQIEVAIGAQP
jgi:hypothetical protein